MANMVSPARGHSWYPRECCSNRDCMPADRVETDDRGDLRVTVGQEADLGPAGI